VALFSRNGVAPTVDPSARVAATASVVGDVTVGDECVVAPQVALAGCEVEERCYLATGVVVLQEARVGRGSLSPLLMETTGR
jgi:carbonic anhydrase/acetyltransferase-like protein (isoleucine patch superfamily)